MSKTALRSGFDSAIDQEKEDHLNRWPLAREIYGITETCPLEWSVRVGVYGEWGTGKTSVLSLVASIASKHGDLVVWFNPWEHKTADTLWQSFVLRVYKAFEEQRGSLPAAEDARKKAMWSRISATIEEIGKASSTPSGSLTAWGLGWVREKLTFAPEDLKSLNDALGGKRIVILIDDLDRTAPELVPEILFALKELMDIPQFAFICAFDPVVVGEVLMRYHPGFGEGLKFLEKIIDYPVWLPAAQESGLLAIAEAERKKFCPYVSEFALRNSMRFLPKNPRVVKQYLRMLMLLKRQVERHNEDELKWQIVLAADALKLRYPKLAPALLENEHFWSSIEIQQLVSPHEETSIPDSVTKHLEKIEKHLKISLNADEREIVFNIMTFLCGQVGGWMGMGPDAMAYQMRIDESPHSVTWKEFDNFFLGWQNKQQGSTVDGWCSHHGEIVGRNIQDVKREVMDAALRRYDAILTDVEKDLIQGQHTLTQRRAEDLMSLIEHMGSALGSTDSTVDVAEEAETLYRIFKLCAKISGWITSDIQIAFRKREKDLLLKIVTNWAKTTEPLIQKFQPFSHPLIHSCESKEALSLLSSIHQIILPKFAKEILRWLREPGFMDGIIFPGDNTGAVRQIFFDVNGYLWGPTYRATTLAELKLHANDAHLQENILVFLRWAIYSFNEKQNTDGMQRFENVLREQDIVEALWGIAMNTKLSENGIKMMARLPPIVSQFGVKIVLPKWFEKRI